MSIDTTKSFVPLNIVIITISDTRTNDNDKSGRFLVEASSSYGHKVLKKIIIPDNLEEIVATLQQYIDKPNVDVIIFTPSLVQCFVPVQISSRIHCDSTGWYSNSFPLHFSGEL